MWQAIEDLPREKLVELLSVYAKNWLAHDGLWYQSIERKLGTEEAMEHNINGQRGLATIEARRIKAFLQLPEYPGLAGLAQALRFRLYSSLNTDEIVLKEDSLVYRMLDCRVQTARRRKNMPLHPCKAAGIEEYTFFAQGIDARIATKCVSCYPDELDDTCACAWEFFLKETTSKRKEEE